MSLFALIDLTPPYVTPGGVTGILLANSSSTDYPEVETMDIN